MKLKEGIDEEPTNDKNERDDELKQRDQMELPVQKQLYKKNGSWFNAKRLPWSTDIFFPRCSYATHDVVNDQTPHFQNDTCKGQPPVETGGLTRS